ncbi:hypothetical protein GCM10011416_06130 [Polaribacter pacificus]|uniref:Vacuolar membrane protease n=1 Tax=Polaribacter pacificus TaxID=1775173 RepID=A0A917HX90_9FLAO|nr:M20/M25/M40 family metallo-hydrolase [Polaribacter pacificus]GGG92068.1 hypothetical protein GCM10011416_06130 [Polaribacter pacificus]
MKKLIPFISVCIILATIFWAFSDMIPSKNQTTANQEKGFVLSNALTHLKNISKEPHFIGASNHQLVRDYLVVELKKLGLEPEVQTATVINKKWFAAAKTQNIIAKIKGSENGKSLVLLSHYDSNPHSSFGASDAGSGVVTILEGVRAFLAENKQPKNDIIILFSDGEELGLLGAKAFVDNHPLAKEVGLVLNFEARGSGGPSYMLMETNGKNSALLKAFLEAKPNYPVANSLMYSIYKMLPNDTDLTVFREEANINGFNFAFIGDHFDYHTAQDTYERLDRATLLHQADYLMTLLPYFSNADLSKLDSSTDVVYTNFPVLGMLQYPYSWGTALLIFSVILTMVLLFFGISLNRITVKGIMSGYIPFVLGLVITAGSCYLLWQGVLWLHPQYNDILHGFTYNGYYYIFAFSCLCIWLLFKLYAPYFKKYNGIDLVVAPLSFWLLINLLIKLYLPGAGYFIIPVYFVLVGMLVHVFLKFKKSTKIIIYSILAIPVIYMFAPQIKMFPVGLGLKSLFISGLFIALIFGLMAPVFASFKSRKWMVNALGVAALSTFVYTYYTSGFNIDNKKPNSLAFIQDNDMKTAYFGSHNQTMDTYTEQIFGKNPTAGSLDKAETRNKYNTRFRYLLKTETKAIPSAKIEILKDTLINGSRLIDMLITPQRNVQKIEFTNTAKISFQQLKINETSANKDKAFTVSNGAFLSYFLSPDEASIQLSIKVGQHENLDIIINEISFDLLESPLFSIKPRDENMMPMPMVSNDAIISIQRIKL